MLALLAVCLSAQDPSLPFASSLGHNRFMNFAAKTQRDIMLSVVKNISEKTEPNTVLLNFRAEDKNIPNYNLT